MKFYVDEKERKKRRRILKLKIYGGIAAFFVLAIGIGYLTIYSPVFKIKRIDAGQNQQLIDELKNFFVGQSKITKFLGPDNILIWQQEKISEFLKDYSQIAELTIEKDYFNRQVQINVREREKFGVWCASSCFWFDKSGVLFAEAPMMEGELINKIYDSTGRELKPGDKILEENLLGNLLKILNVLQKSELWMKNLYLQDLSLQEISVESPLLPQIYFSLRFNPESTLPAIQSIKELGLAKIEYIDFRVENRAYYKVK